MVSKDLTLLSEIARELGKKPSILSNLARTGQITATKKNNRWYANLDEVHRELYKRSAIKFQKQFSSFLSKSLDIPIISIDGDAIEQIVKDLVQEDPELKIHYSIDELHSEVSNFVSFLAVSPPKTDEELHMRIDNFVEALQKEKSYEAMIVLPGVIGLPIGTQIGSLEIVQESKYDKHLKDYISAINESKRVYPEGKSYAVVSFSSYTTQNVQKIFYDTLELAFAILSLLMNFDLDARDCVGIIKSQDVSTRYYLEPHKDWRGLCKYHPKTQETYLNILSEISLDVKPNQLSKKILQALQVYGLSSLSYKPEIRFLLLVSSFESLLLTTNDRDYLGKKLSEKVAFLLENDYTKRLELYKLMKKYYAKRSDLVHKGVSSIAKTDVITLQAIFRSVIFKILELSKEYTKMEQKSHDKDKVGLEDYINKLKFS